MYSWNVTQNVNYTVHHMKRTLCFLTLQLKQTKLWLQAIKQKTWKCPRWTIYPVSPSAASWMSDRPVTAVHGKRRKLQNWYYKPPLNATDWTKCRKKRNLHKTAHARAHCVNFAGLIAYHHLAMACACGIGCRPGSEGSQSIRRRIWNTCTTLASSCSRATVSVNTA